MIYVIAAPEISPGRVKIGYTSKKPIFRMGELQTGCPVLLELIMQFNGDMALEKELHKWFAPFRTHCEWFEFGELDAAQEIADVYEACEGDFRNLRQMRSDVMMENRKRLQQEHMAKWRAGQGR